MQTMIRGFADFSTSMAIAASIWWLRKKKRWSRLRMALGQRWLAGPAPAAVAAEPAPLAPQRIARPIPTPLDHIEVVEDSDWQVWETAVSSQGCREKDRATS